MKIIWKLALLFICFTNLAFTLRLRSPFDKPPLTPKAADLSDHFGTDSAQGIYGPKLNAVQRLMREGITGRDTPISPINNFNTEIIPSQVVSGELDNTSYDASKIIKPIIAGNFLFHNFCSLNLIFEFLKSNNYNGKFLQLC